MRDQILPIAIVISLIVIAAIDLVVFPSFHLALLYVVPLAIAAFRPSPWIVMLTAMVVFALDFLDFFFGNAPLGVWLLSFVALVLVCSLAFLRAAEAPLPR